jgi:hypothetical protein
MIRRLALPFLALFVLLACETKNEVIQAPPDDPATGDDGTLPGDDAGDASTKKTDGSTAKALCHSGGYDCKDGIPCCGTYVCKDGSCKDPKGTMCVGFGFDCSVNGCCPGTDCTSFTFGERCIKSKTCTKQGGACADTGNCCGGLSCQSGTCKPPPRQDSCKVYGERCGAKDCCPSTPYCENETCCMPGDWNNTSCGQDSDCCTGVCNGGLCELSGLGGPCTFDDDCGKDPSVVRCQVSTSTCCAPKDARCTNPSDCCSGSCTAGKCACLPKGATSTSSGNCCSLVMVGTTCQ